MCNARTDNIIINSWKVYNDGKFNTAIIWQWYFVKNVEEKVKKYEIGN